MAQTSCIASPAGNYTNGQYGDADSANPSHSNHGATYLGQIGNQTWSNDTGDVFSVFVPRDTGLFLELTSQSDFSLSISNSSSVILAISNYSTSGGNTATVTTNGTGFTNSSTVLVSISPNNSTTGNYTLLVGIFSTLDQSLIGNQSEVIDAEIQIGYFQCRAGTYQSKTGRSNCDLALPGRYVSISGATSEELCTPGNYQPLSGQSSRLTAQQGYYVTQSGALSQTPASRKLCSQLRREFSDTVLAGQLSTVFRAGQLFSRRPRFLRGFVWVLQPDCLQSLNLSAVQWLHQLHRYFSWLFYDIFQLNFSDRLLSRTYQPLPSQSSCVLHLPATLYPGLLVSLRLVVIQDFISPCQIKLSACRQHPVIMSPPDRQQIRPHVMQVAISHPMDQLSASIPPAGTM